jgi:hypothetical protein
MQFDLPVWVGILFFIYFLPFLISGNLFPLTGVFKPFTFKVMIEKLY